MIKLLSFPKWVQEYPKMRMKQILLRPLKREFLLGLDELITKIPKKSTGRSKYEKEANLTTTYENKIFLLLDQ